ncbi:MAG: cyclic nucleotide-binding domain-containing protein [Rhodospirillales bacterium]|nr:cyclic nucleotide-binding domain-containing protein [Rhodospirillales bacterium]
MAKNLAGKTYEVLTADGNRWILDSTHDIRSTAMQAAEEIIGLNKHDGVRVVAETERTGETEVIFEETIDHDYVVTIASVEDAPVCKNTADFYRFPARRTAGRLLRNLLDDQGLTALELAFNPGQLMMFERNDRLFGPGLQRIAGIQAKATGTEQSDRADFLFRAFDEIKERAKSGIDIEKYSALLKAKGLNALIEGANQWEKGDNQEMAVLAALAAHITGRADWDGKLLVLAKLGEGAPSAEAVGYLDEIVAEILDGAEAVRQVLGGQPDSAAANRMLIRLSHGDIQPPKKTLSCIVELNEMMARLDMPQAQSVLLERVAVEISGVHHLTKEGRDADREAFVGLVRELADGDGLIGGPRMCEAVVKRARIALSGGEKDLSVEHAIDNLHDLMPNRAVRLGFLLDLLNSPLGRKEGELIMDALGRIAKQLSFLASLVPDADGPERVLGVVEKLKRRLEHEGVPAEFRKSLTDNLNELVKKATGSEKQAKKNYSIDGTEKMSDPTGERKTFKTGDVIFKEGDAGDLAYLIVKGGVEIYRNSGNSERILAKLGRGQIIGEMALVDSQPRVASARAMEDCEFSLISQKSLQQRLDKLDETDKVLRRLIDVLVTRVRGQAQSPE